MKSSNGVEGIENNYQQSQHPTDFDARAIFQRRKHLVEAPLPQEIVDFRGLRSFDSIRRGLSIVFLMIHMIETYLYHICL